MAPTHEHVIPGTIYGAVPRFPPDQPYIPIPAAPTAGDTQPASASAPVPPMEWDTGLVSHGFNWTRVDNDRRHSGWEEVEKRWMRQQQQQQQDIEQQQSSQQAASAQPRGGSGPRPKKDTNSKAAALFPYPHLAVPVPGLSAEPDFRMRVKLNPQSASVAVGDGFKKWTTFTEGEWSGRLGCGAVVSGGQDCQDLVHGTTMATQVEATHRLKTADEVPAFIECKTRGFRTGPAEAMRALRDPGEAATIDPRQIQYRVSLSMKTTDERYAEKVNLGLWIGSCLWRGSEVIYDVYRVT
ncbi:hypothetical protein F5B22DRAFT_34734 [Xylaria bambusicola]|uniref:uncharacterized protein n=1 Tax=Xylaria bambusicola TaxID=326684 RepID=UPI002007C4AD|nr:uncharacterized protein F5B22DRAFT_34734 [Xylaria bambusicola]KAI0521025.1 hypothetical protein F5B22DRAFT_34734 [Xylaria bambusicola]